MRKKPQSNEITKRETVQGTFTGSRTAGNGSARYRPQSRSTGNKASRLEAHAAKSRSTMDPTRPGSAQDELPGERKFHFVCDTLRVYRAEVRNAEMGIPPRSERILGEEPFSDSDSPDINY